jgi:hypothetical protein
MNVRTKITKHSNESTIHLAMFFIDFSTYDGMGKHQKGVLSVFSEVSRT